MQLIDKQDIEPVLTKSQSALGKSCQFSTELLFAGGKEVVIVHGEDAYVLRITKQGKLILTK